MHLVGDDQKRPNKGRTSSERYFKRFNALVMAVQFACLLISITNCTIAGRKTFQEGLWTGSTLTKVPMLRHKMRHCVLNGSVDFFAGYSDILLYISPESDSEHFVELIGSLRFALLATASSFFVGSINRILFDWNAWYVRYRHIYIRKCLLTALEIFLLVLQIGSVDAVDAPAAFLRKYLRYCGVVTERTLPFAVPLTSLYVSFSVTMFAHLLSTLILLSHALKKHSSLKPPTDAMNSSTGDSTGGTKSFLRTRQGEYIYPSGPQMNINSNNQRFYHVPWQGNVSGAVGTTSNNFPLRRRMDNGGGGAPVFVHVDTTGNNNGGYPLPQHLGNPNQQPPLFSYSATPRVAPYKNNTPDAQTFPSPTKGQ